MDNKKTQHGNSSGTRSRRPKLFVLAVLLACMTVSLHAPITEAGEYFDGLHPRFVSTPSWDGAVVPLGWTQPSPIAPRPSTEVDVAFEPLGIKTLLPSPRGYHAVIIMIDLNTGAQTAFQASYSGRPGNFGSLQAAERDLEEEPLAPDSVRELATELFFPTANYLRWMQR